MGRSTIHKTDGDVVLTHAGRVRSTACARRRADEVHVTASAQPDAETLRCWDQLIATTPCSDVAQLSAWADVRRQVGFTPIFVLARDADRMVGGALILQRRLPGVGSIGYLPHGPVLAADGGGAAVADVMCRALAHVTRRHLRTLFVQPPRGAHAISHRLLQLGFRPSTAGITPAASLELDLSQPAEHLLRGMSSGTRSGIRGVTARGVLVRTATADDLPVVAELLAETAAHHRFPPPSPGYLHTVYEQLAPGNHVKIFIAEHDGIPMATQLLTCSGGLVTLRLTGMRRSEARSGAGALLQWETILWAKANGYTGFDFGGISASAVDAIRAGRANLAARVNGRDYFKASFGGHPTHYPQAVELFPSTPTRVGYDLARRSELGKRLIRRARHALRGTAR